MTREEAIKEIEKAFEPAFANYIITALTEGATVSDKEPTTKNDLEVDCISKTETLKAMETWDKFGLSARYGLKRLDKDDKEYIPYVKYDDMVNCVKGMPSVTPQEPKSEWEHDHEILKAYSNGANEVLDKIRAEIQTIIGERNLDDYDFCSGLIVARKIIDKYKAESEE